MDLTEARLRDVLGTRAFQFFPQIGSTNDQALMWLEAGGLAGSIVIADEQTKGRGRLGRSWFAPPSTALMFSYLLRPKADELTYVGMAGALAVCEAAEAFEVTTSIKWPNDVQVTGRKLCGVLPEVSWRGDELAGVALGIGVNVRIDFSDTPFAETATSLETAAGVVDRAELLARLLERLDFWSARLASDDLFEAWRGRLNMIGRQVSINNVSGVAEVVDRQGALLIRDEAGNMQRIIAGDIALG